GFYISALNEQSFQLKLFETSNTVQFVYGAHPGTTSTAVYVGLTGATTSDISARTTTTSWAATTSGTGTSSCTVSGAIFPANGSIFQWTSAATVAGMTFSYISGGVYVPIQGGSTSTDLTTAG